MEKITITAVSRKERISTRNNKPYTSIGLQTREYGEAWLSGFGADWNANWKAGDVVEIVKEEATKDGKTYLNFSKPDTESMLLDQFNKLAERVSNLEHWRTTHISMHSMTAGQSYSAPVAQVPTKEMQEDPKLPF